MKDSAKLYEWLDALVAKVGKETGSEETAESVRIIAQYAKVAIGLWRVMPGGTVDGVKVTRIVVKTAPRSPELSMLVVQGKRGKKDVVTFHTGDGGAGMFHTFIERAASGALRWREDTPYVEATADETIQGLPDLPGA